MITDWFLATGGSNALSLYSGLGPDGTSGSILRMSNAPMIEYVGSGAVQSGVSLEFNYKYVGPTFIYVGLRTNPSGALNTSGYYMYMQPQTNLSSLGRYTSGASNPIGATTVSVTPLFTSGYNVGWHKFRFSAIDPTGMPGVLLRVEAFNATGSYWETKGEFLDLTNDLYLSGTCRINPINSTSDFDEIRISSLP